ncbi:MAG TPA: hypothetical protein PKZ76_15615 [Xanthomonadaceae bacterium]|nr:hypothetical protein [Xanthomonadaceae bacterium]
MAHPAQLAGGRAQLLFGALGQRLGDAGEQDLTGPREIHQARRDRLGQAFDLDPARTLAYIFDRVIPDHHVADMNADPAGQRQSDALSGRAQGTLIVEGEGDRMDGSFEQREKALGLVRLEAAVATEQFAYQMIVFAHQVGGVGLIDATAKGFDRKIAEHQGAQLRRWRLPCGGRWCVAGNGGAALTVAGHDSVPCPGPAGIDQGLSTRPGRGASGPSRRRLRSETEGTGPDIAL